MMKRFFSNSQENDNDNNDNDNDNDNNNNNNSNHNNSLHQRVKDILSCLLLTIASERRTSLSSQIFETFKTYKRRI